MALGKGELRLDDGGCTDVVYVGMCVCVRTDKGRTRDGEQGASSEREMAEGCVWVVGGCLAPNPKESTIVGLLSSVCACVRAQKEGAWWCNFVQSGDGAGCVGGNPSVCPSGKAKDAGAGRWGRWGRGSVARGERVEMS